jgi:16S rRNA (adenine1518-N6/adenine1519-N6)-dimethyltransferase
LSVRAQVRYDVKLVRKVSPGVFFPPPNVESAIVSFKRRADWKPGVVSEDFDSFIRYIFTQRRKKMNKNLIKAYGGDEVKRVYEEMNFTGNERAEELSPARLIELAERFGF